MAPRKRVNSLLAAVKNAESKAPEKTVLAANATSPAAKTLKESIRADANERAMFINGQTIVEIDPAILHDSNVRDRRVLCDESFQELVDSIAMQGQLSPIMVRPHPKQRGHYQIIYGHRRAAAAKFLGLKTRAIIREVKGAEVAIFQGQENSIRQNLSYLERCFFARELRASGEGSDTIMEALNIKKSALSMMNTFMDIVPEDILNAFGAGRDIGRPKWDALKETMKNEDNYARALDIINNDEFKKLPAAPALDLLISSLKQKPKRSKARPQIRNLNWTAGNKAVSVQFKKTPIQASINIKADAADGFADYLAGKIEDLHIEFLKGIDE